MIQAVVSPIAVMVLTGNIQASIKGVPIAPFIALVGIAVAAVVWKFTRVRSVPRFFLISSALSFTMSVVWIYFIATEIVDILSAFGIFYNISTAVLGLTVLTWGTSIGDVVANVVMARKGYARMAIAASYAGPLFNMFVGLGIATFVHGISYYPTPVAASMNGHLFVANVTFALCKFCGSLF